MERVTLIYYAISLVFSFLTFFLYWVTPNRAQGLAMVLSSGIITGRLEVIYGVLEIKFGYVLCKVNTFQLYYHSGPLLATVLLEEIG